MSSKRTKIYRSFSSEATKRLGEALARRIVGGRAQVKRNKGALVLALRGELGAGKTTFVQGFLKGLGLKKRAPSPTFIIMRRHTLKHKRFSSVFHVDAYRLKDEKALKMLDFTATLADPRNIALIEWADRVKKIIPKNALWLRFKHGKKEHAREIVIIR